MRWKRRLGGSFETRYVGSKDEGGADDEERSGQPVGRIQVDAGHDWGESPADDERQHHRQQRHRVGCDERRARQDRRNHGCLCRAEQLTDGREHKRDDQQMNEVAAQLRDQRGQWNERYGRGTTDVAPKHDLLAIEPVRNNPRGWREKHGRHCVREQRDGDRGAATRDLVREDDQREEQELVG